MNLTVTIPIVIMEQDFAADVEVFVTARSKPEEACEWELVNISVRPWKRGARLPDVETPIWLSLMIESSDELAEAVATAERHEPRR